MNEENVTESKETSIGLDENIAGAAAYLLGFITGIIMLLVEKDSEFVRFHAAQSTVVFGALLVISIALSVLGGGMAFGGITLGIVSLLLGLLSMLISLIAFVLWIYLMYMAYQGNKVRLPMVAGIADDLI